MNIALFPHHFSDIHAVDIVSHKRGPPFRLTKRLAQNHPSSTYANIDIATCRQFCRTLQNIPFAGDFVKKVKVTKNEVGHFLSLH